MPPAIPPFDNAADALDPYYEGRLWFCGSVLFAGQWHLLEAVCEVSDTLEGDVVTFDCLPDLYFWTHNLGGLWRRLER